MKSLAEKELEDFDKVFKALAHPTRRHILVVLRSREDKMPAGEIVRGFQYKWPTMTRHLQQLEQAGIITVTKQGTQNLYEFNRKMMTNILDKWIRWFQ
ncbi:helix-turn-helix transcriptional regulator [Crocinitomix catalasitica]|nr:helix-turn-helix transcriptional regulator [Crocinitomix catalasitica]